MSDIPICRSARDAIDDLRYEEEGTYKTFVPLDRLRAYLRSDKIGEILSCACSTCGEDLRAFNNGVEPKDYVKRIGGDTDPTDSRKTFYSVFALLIHTEHPMFIVGFVDYDCNDYFLESLAAHSTLSKEDLKRYTGEYKGDARKYDRFAKRFLASLFQFAVPHLEANGFSHFGDRTVLPFVEEVEIGTRKAENEHLTWERANGKVFAFKIYREYNFPNFSSRTEYVRKRIITPTPQAFLERSDIQYVQQFKDNHIVKLIKAYGHGESINLILPRAWTNLHHLLRDSAFKYDSKRGAALEMADAWIQLLGISNALKEMHGYGDKAKSRARDTVQGRICIHFDLKPDNILVERGGNWLITDFGQAALTERRRNTTPCVGGHFGTDAYAPPEIDDTSMGLGRTYDIWSLGCIALEVVAFVHYGYVGLNGTTTFTGLDQARKAMPQWCRDSDERFFCQEVPNGEYLVKREIQTFKANLEASHARSNDKNAPSIAFLSTIMDLIDTMLDPRATKRTDISRVVDTLSSALAQATANPAEETQYHVEAAPDEIILGGRKVNEIKLWHATAAVSNMRRSNLEILQSDAGFMRLYCWARGHHPSNVSFRRTDAKIVPLYAFWDREKIQISRTWIEFLNLSSRRCSKVPSSMYSFDGSSGLNQARLIQSIVTSQEIVDSFNLRSMRLHKPLSLGQAFKNLFRKKTDAVHDSSHVDEPSSDLGSATVQIWVEQAPPRPRLMNRRISLVSRTRTTSRLRPINPNPPATPPCRVVIYLHKQHFVCTVKIDTNWVVEESKADPRVLLFKPLPTGRNRTFHASWLRPTPEELGDEEQYPAGIPLDPKVLQYYEELDPVEVEDMELSFLSLEDRDAFKWKYLTTKRDWAMKRQQLDDTVEVNRAPDGDPQLPDGITHLPVPAKRVPFFVNTGMDKDTVSASSTITDGSGHDTTLEDPTLPQDPRFLVVTEPGKQRNGKSWPRQKTFHSDAWFSPLPDNDLQASDPWSLDARKPRFSMVHSAYPKAPRPKELDVRKSTAPRRDRVPSRDPSKEPRRRIDDTGLQLKMLTSDGSTKIREVDDGRREEKPKSQGTKKEDDASQEGVSSAPEIIDHANQKQELAINKTALLVQSDTASSADLPDVEAFRSSHGTDSSGSPFVTRYLKRSSISQVATQSRNISTSDQKEQHKQRESFPHPDADDGIIERMIKLDASSPPTLLKDKQDNETSSDAWRPCVQRFVFLLTRDSADGISAHLKSMNTSILPALVRTFAQRLYEESTSPFQWETSVILYKRRLDIVRLLTTSKIPATETPATKQQDPQLQSVNCQDFVSKSNAFKWLVTSLDLYHKVPPEQMKSMMAIGASVRDYLLTEPSLQIMSPTKASVKAQLTVKLDWDPIQVAKVYGFKYPYGGMLDSLYCLTGSQEEAQISTIEEYMTQLWPASSEALIHLVRELLSTPDGEQCFYEVVTPTNLTLIAVRHHQRQYQFTVTGGLYLISEIVEQLGWLCSATKTAPAKNYLMTCSPSLTDFRSTPVIKTGSIAIIAECRMRVTFHDHERGKSMQHVQHVPLRLRSYLIYGYPALRRARVSERGMSDNDPLIACLSRYKTNDLQILRLRLPETLSAVVETTPKHLIEVHQSNDLSLLDGIKRTLENHTGCLWDWSPLKAPREDVPLGSSRVQWIMYGCRLQSLVTEEIAMLLKDILSTINDHPRMCYCCMNKTIPLSPSDLIVRVARLVVQQVSHVTGWISHTDHTPSSSSQVYTPGGTVSSGVARLQPTLQIRGRRNNTPPPQPTTPQTSTTIAGGPVDRYSCQHVLFAVKGLRWSWELDLVPITTAMCDSTFFRTLRSHHRRHRRAYLHWASPYRFKNCRCVKLEVIEPHRILAGTDQALPEDYDQAAEYDYNPRPPNAKLPLIDPRLYAILLSECAEDCWWRVLPSHECIRFRSESSHMMRIPRRRDDIRQLLDTGKGMAFGIEADYVLSYTILGIYHLATIIPAFIFWSYWLSRHPGDWQNASVPLLTILALVTVFWLMIGKKAGIS